MPPQNSRALAITDELESLYPHVHCELDFTTPFELLVATILSAQCTDKRVNMVTPALFARFPDAKHMAEASTEELEALVRSTGFYRNKAKSLKNASQLLVDDHAGVVPRSMDELLTLPGVARKTANVILGNAYDMNEGMAVDTHVMRLAQRWKLTTHDDPVNIERDLCAMVPRVRWTRVGHQIIWHGRRVCEAKAPRCDACTLAPLCPSAYKVGMKVEKVKAAKAKAAKALPRKKVGR